MLRNFAIIRVLAFLNNPKDLDPSYKMDLDFWDCFGRKISPTYNRRNTVPVFRKHWLLAVQLLILSDFGLLNQIIIDHFQFLTLDNKKQLTLITSYDLQLELDEIVLMRPDNKCF